MAVKTRLFFILCFVIACITSTPAFAQDAAAPVLTPPSIDQFVEADYPPQARAEHKTARVELEVTISAEGHVTDARVVTPVGDGFDEAALAAVRQFQFNPAERNGQRIAARIRYTYVFEIHEEPASEVVASPTTETSPENTAPPAPIVGRFEGRVLDRAGDAGLAGASVDLLAEDGSVTQSSVCDAQGAFAFDALAPGVVHVRVSLAEYETTVADETVVANEAVTVTYRVAKKAGRDTQAFRAVATIDPPPREVTRRTLESAELVSVAGTRGDALRVIELLPGVGRPPGLAGLLIVRGSAPQDSQVFLEGMPVPLLYHFGGLTSFMNSRLIDRIDFFPGNFSVRFGRKMGGIIDVGVRDPLIDAYHAVIDVNLIDSSFIVEGPVGEHASFSVAARRSYIDFFFSNVVPKGTFSILAAPVYWDYQANFTWHPTTNDRIRFMGYGSSDKFQLVLSDPALDSDVKGNLDLQTNFHRLQVDWRHRYSDSVDQTVSFAIGPDQTKIDVGSLLQLNVQPFNILGRAEWVARLNDRVRLISGLDMNILPTHLTFLGPAPTQMEGNPGGGSAGTQNQANADLHGLVYRPAAYVEVGLHPFDPLQIQAGVRVDWSDEIKKWNVDPRLSARYALDEHWTIKAGVGLFSQPPQFQESARLLGNPQLMPNRALHVGAGFDHKFNDTFSIGVEGFYKWLDELVVSTADGLSPNFVNAGVGRIYGLEVSARARPMGRFFGFLSYTFSKSERRDQPNAAWRLFDYDQTHILTLAAGYRLGRGWEVGGTFRLVSGNPTTPIVGSIYDARYDSYLPINGAVNSSRLPLFHRLDVRVEKKWTFTSWSLAAYLDVQNVYNRQNQEGIRYNFDFSQSTVLPGLPIIPSIGLRGEI